MKTSTRDSRTTRRHLRRVTTCAVAMSALIGVGACGSSSTHPTDGLAGLWSASDGSGTKIVRPDGSCTGMYYAGTEPLDIGGGMMCALSDSAKSNGNYNLIVRQPPNEASYEVQFVSPDEANLISGGRTIVTLKRM